MNKNYLNTITCTFYDNVLEDKYNSQQWNKLKKYTVLILLLMTATGFQNLYNFNSIVGNFRILLPLFILFFMNIVILPFTIMDKISYKFFYNYFIFFLCIYFPAVLIIRLIYNIPLPIEASAFPLSFLFIIFIAIQFSFVYTIVASIIICVPWVYFIFFNGYISFGYMPSLYFFPFILLIIKKRSDEIINRKAFAREIHINENKKIMNETLKKYFGETLTDQMLKEHGAIAGANNWVTIMFTDIKSYSSIVEYMSPEVALEFLNDYFTEMHKVIDKYDGHILNFIGDCLMVVFNSPKKIKDHELVSVKCAVEMRERLVGLNKKWDEMELSRYWKNHGIELISARTGIHTGSVITGNIGSVNMLQYSAIGDVVNIASRLEKANKEYNTSICLSEEIYTALTKKFSTKVKKVGNIKLKGIDKVKTIYSI